MQLSVGQDLTTFTARAEDFLHTGIERNILATVHRAVHSGRYPDAYFATVADPQDRVVAVGMRTPPHNLLVAGEITDPDEFMAAWRQLDPAIPGVTGEPSLARPLAAAWASLSGGQTHLHMNEALHVLSHVVMPQSPAAGILRRADWREAAQLTEWGRTFGRETRIANPDIAAAAIEAHLERQSLYVWEHDGQATAMVGHTVSIDAVVRIGPVYTPAELRGHGYASVATATLSQRLLEGGARSCILYTDLANPISNHVYAKIGYVRSGEWEEHLFTPPPA